MDDWKVGDLALCVKRGADDVFAIEGTTPLAPGPIVGLVYTVSGVRRAVDCYGRPGIALRLSEIHIRHTRSCGFNSVLFRKASATEVDEFDREVIDLMTKQPAEVR